MPKRAVAIPTVVLAPFLMAQQNPPADAAPVKSDLDQACTERCFTPIEAVTLASQVAPKGGIAGLFAIQIKAVGEKDGRFYLNSEADYRDRNCLTVSLPPAVAQALIGQADLSSVRERFVGKWIYVDGVAKRVTILIAADGKPTGMYYYQVHVTVNDPRQIRYSASPRTR
jgi:hypothetical protein